MADCKPRGLILWKSEVLNLTKNSKIMDKKIFEIFRRKILNFTKVGNEYRIRTKILKKENPKVSR